MDGESSLFFPNYDGTPAVSDTSLVQRNIICMNERQTVKDGFLFHFLAGKVRQC